MPAHSGAAARQPAVVVPSAPEVQAAANPRANCGGRILLAMHQCLVRECAKPQYQAHAECDRVRMIEERARNNQP